MITTLHTSHITHGTSHITHHTPSIIHHTASIVHQAPRTNQQHPCRLHQRCSLPICSHAPTDLLRPRQVELAWLGRRSRTAMIPKLHDRHAPRRPIEGIFSYLSPLMLSNFAIVSPHSTQLCSLKREEMQIERAVSPCAPTAGIAHWAGLRMGQAAVA